MELREGVWCSDFCDEYAFDANWSVVSVCSGSGSSQERSAPSVDFGGGHSVIFLEQVEQRTGDAVLIKVDLVTPGDGGVIVRIDEKERNGVPTDPDRAVDGSAYARTSFQVQHGQGLALVAAARRYRGKAEAGRYVYKLPGGILGRMLTLHRRGKRGVNCADFAIKILAEANITRVSPHALVNSPARARRRA